MDIYVVKTSGIENIDEKLLLEFQKKEFSNLKKRQIHSFSYLILDRILREVYKINDREIKFDNQKPVLKTGEKHFSISHSGEYIALGFSDTNCGIDIERIDDKRDWQAIAERMKFKSQSLEEFYKDWTRYEAEYKLGNKCKAGRGFKVEDYIITAVSENTDEDFEFYMMGN